MTEIEHGVPIPAAQTGGGPGRACKYPWFEMGHGDSFLVDVEDEPKNVRSSGSAWLKRNRVAWRCVARQLSDGRTRVWFLDMGLDDG